MYCPNCGKENPDHALFCASCGEDLRPLTDPTEEVVWEEGSSDWADEPAWTEEFAPAPPVEREKKRSILGITLILEGVVLAILLVIIFLNLGQNRSPRLAAEKTFVALTNGNMEEALRHMDVKDSPFTRKENLRKAWHSWGFDQVTSYRIAGAKEEGAGVKADQVDIPISYTAKDLEGDHEVNFTMVKDPSALFLDNPWKVSSDLFVVEDLEVVVPEGVSVRLDGEEPPLDGSRKEGDHISYVIPQAFTGVHSLEIAKDNRAIQANYYVDRDNKTILMGWDSGDDSSDGETILETIRENTEKIAKTFIEQGSFSSIRSLFAEDWVDEVKKKYEEAFANYEMLPFIQSFEVRSMEAQLDKEEKVVNLSMDYRVRYYTIPEDNKLVIQETRGERDLVIHYEEENGTIKQADLGLAVPLEYVR
ncbi:zinc ribbon domain-containing protein [Kallipyga massiliensis]|uniref:zinc-ribbon domain-containing protein n=1 Tax=Kallipyga massiliensis TaxID=1472764 RepID=UPI0026EA54E2|nr:zinc ribbon domain-containing protein [Kallipyga massiliensis]